MLRVSNYNICIPIGNEKNEYLLAHGYSGAVDVVTVDIADLINKAEGDPSSLSILSDDNLNILKTRGYITELSTSDEKKLFSKISSAMHKVVSKEIGLTLVPTYNCNFRCTYCFEQSNFAKGNDFLHSTMDKSTVDEIFSAIRTVVNNGSAVLNQITLFGGEPLLKENYGLISYIVQKAKESCIELNAITNGYDLDSYENLLGKGKIASLQITIDGPEAYHNKKRFLVGGKPTFNKVTENIGLCISKGVKVSVRSNIDQYNLEQIEELINFFGERGWIESEYFSHYFKCVHTCHIKDKNEEILDDMEIMDKLSRIVDKYKKFKFNSIYSRLDSLLTYLLKNKKMILLNAEYCGSIKGMMVIDPYKDIYPCWEVIGNKEHVIGRLEDGNVVLNENSQFWQNRCVHNIEECSECAYALFCGGGCPAHAKASNGNIYTPYCEKYKEIFNEVLQNVYQKCFSNPGT